MDEVTPRLRALYDLNVAVSRDYAGRHEYDGQVQDLSPGGVRAALARLGGDGADPEDPHDAEHLAAFEDLARVEYGELELHRRNPYAHLGALDLAGYDRPYAPEQDRRRARETHLTAWPAAIDAAVAALDRVSPVTAEALRPAVGGLLAGIPAGTPDSVVEPARAAHARLLAHLASAAADADGPPPQLGAAGLARLMSAPERMEVDLGRLAERADAERDRLMARLADSCAKLEPGRTPLVVARELVRDHPGPDGVLAAARHWTERAIAFCDERQLVPYPGGECLVTPSPESRRWAMAMMEPAAPGEPDGPSFYQITPPGDDWPEREREEWLEVFSATTLPGITVHEVAPGHFSHFRALRQAPTLIRRTLMSLCFIEGWAHYAEELCVEEGFEAADPRFEIGVWLEALVRVTRLACSIGVHTGAMTVAEGARRFAADTHLAGPAAASEARRATFDPTYGRYTWGKLEILKLRDSARQQWGASFSLPRFHAALLALGSPPLGLMGTAIVRG